MAETQTYTTLGYRRFWGRDLCHIAEVIDFGAPGAVDIHPVCGRLTGACLLVGKPPKGEEPTPDELAEWTTAKQVQAVCPDPLWVLPGTSRDCPVCRRRSQTLPTTRWANGDPYTRQARGDSDAQ